MAKKLFLGSLAWSATDESVRELFERFGEVTEVTVVRDGDTGRSRGFGFVTFADDSAAETAMAEMDGAEIDGRPVRIAEAHERGSAGPRRGGRGIKDGRSPQRD